jgi:hypothetical protein
MTYDNGNGEDRSLLAYVDTQLVSVRRKAEHENSVVVAKIHALEDMIIETRQDFADAHVEVMKALGVLCSAIKGMKKERK